MSESSLIDYTTLEETTQNLSSSESELDILPTRFFKPVLHPTADVLQTINASLETTIFPELLKRAVKPLPKKNNIEASALSNCRPISNIPVNGKILEKIVFN